MSMDVRNTERLASAGYDMSVRTDNLYRSPIFSVVEGHCWRLYAWGLTLAKCPYMEVVGACSLAYQCLIGCSCKAALLDSVSNL